MGASEERNRVAVSESHDATGAIELGAVRSRTSSRHHDPESSPLAWLCVLGSFMFLYPSYGEFLHDTFVSLRLCLDSP